MPNYRLTAINVGSFPLGESDKVLTLFSAERGLTRAVAKGARKPGAKIAGRAEVLKVNRLLLATGRSLDIITQAEELVGFSQLRQDLNKLSYALYYAELTAQFGQGLADESETFFHYFCNALKLLLQIEADPILLCLQFELYLLATLGYKPELDSCVVCRQTLTDYNVRAFDHDLGGIICQSCPTNKRIDSSNRVAEGSFSYESDYSGSVSLKTYVTPLVWKSLILSSRQSDQAMPQSIPLNNNLIRANQAGHKLIQTYIEHKAGRKMKALELISSIPLK